MKFSSFRPSVSDTVSFCLLMFVSILFSAVNGHLWEHDFANYHYYNPWAFLNGRLDTDIIPNGIHHFLNPLIDIPFYLIVAWFNEFSYLGYALQGIWTGLYMFAAYKIAGLFFRKTPADYFAITLFLTLAFTRECTYMQIGTPTNEHAVGTFVLFGIYQFLYTIKMPDATPGRLFISGLLFGLAFGLKATAVTWCLASGITLILCLKLFHAPLKTLTLFVTGGVTGYLAVNGYFMLHYWEMYQNPFFPLLNGIFHSAFYDASNYSERGFCPRGWEYLQIPYLWLKHPRVNEWDNNEKILILTHAVMLLILGASLFAKTRRHLLNHCLLITLSLLWFVAFYIWLGMFSVLRYFIVGETLGSLIIVFTATRLYDTIARRLTRNKKIKEWFSPEITYIFSCIALGIILLSPKISATAGNIGNRPAEMLSGIKEMYRIVLPQDSLVELYNNDSSYVIPVLAKNSRFTVIGHPKNFWHRDRFEKGNESRNFGKFNQLADKLRRQYAGNTYKIINFKYYSTGDLIANHSLIYSILNEDEYCYEFPTFLHAQTMLLCLPKHKVSSVIYRPQPDSRVAYDRYGLKLAEQKISINYKTFEQKIFNSIFTNICL